ncbi:ETX/MTX2 family pore-forming toxin [Microbacterium proteolyticum]|uniref:ETX/MTX2 family pore-forming toxin n=1 Tax=Microbacterium proteolyticum TaxID=1572644 RepID=UPI0035BFAECC
MLRTVGIACAASMMLVALPIGMAHAAGPRMPSALPTTGDPKLEAALKAAPELEGATFDVSGVTFAPGEITVANPKFTSTGPAIMSDNTMQNPLNPADPDQPTYSLTTTSQSYTRTDTTTYTRTHEFGTSLALGYTFQWGINLGAFSGQHQYSATMTLSYKYSDSVATTATDTKTITSTPQTVPVRPGHSVRVVQFVDIGKYEADLTVNGTLQGNVVVKKCGNAVSLPIGQLAALPRDAGQGPLVPSSTPDGDVLRQTATVRWVADLATQAYTRVTDTVMATKSVTETTTPSGTTPTGTSPSRNTPMVKSAPSSSAASDYPTLRSVVSCVPPAVRQFTPSATGATVKVDAALLTSSSRVIYWVNGRYVGEHWNGSCYYGACSRLEGRFRYVDISARDGDLIQVGIVPGQPNEERPLPPPEKSQLLGTYRVGAGVRTATIESGMVKVMQNRALTTGPSRVVAWLNGKYLGETQNNVTYYGYSTWPWWTLPLGSAPVSVYFNTANPQPGDLLQIGIVPGNPGDKLGEPRSSKLLYEAKL